MAPYPAAFDGRLFYQHNENVTLMRTTVEENVAIGRFLAEKLNACAGPVREAAAHRWMSALDAPEQPFWDSAADEALFSTVEAEVNRKGVVRRVPHHINDPEFADVAVAAWREVLA